MPLDERTAQMPERVLADDSDNGTDAALKFTPEQVERARKAISDEDRWFRRNRDWWAERVEAPCVDDARAGRRFSVRAVMERERWTPFSDELGKPMRVSNCWSAIWARRILRRHPECGPYMVVRDSPLDVVLGAA